MVKGQGEGMMKLVSYRVLSTAVALLVFGTLGCASTLGNKKIANEKIMSQIKEGQSTKGDVKKLLGEPNDTHSQGNGEVWHYTYSKTTTSGMGASMFLNTINPVPIPVTVAKDKSTDLEVYILFDNSDVVRKIGKEKSMLQGI